jgi:hypothetical protein
VRSRRRESSPRGHPGGTSSAHSFATPAIRSARWGTSRPVYTASDNHRSAHLTNAAQAGILVSTDSAGSYRSRRRAAWYASHGAPFGVDHSPRSSLVLKARS